MGKRGPSAPRGAKGSGERFQPDTVDFDDFSAPARPLRQANPTAGDAEAIRKEPDDRLIRGTVHRRRRDPDFERVSMEPDDLGPRGPRLHLQLNPDPVRTRRPGGQRSRLSRTVRARRMIR